MCRANWTQRLPSQTCHSKLQTKESGEHRRASNLQGMERKQGLDEDPGHSSQSVDLLPLLSKSLDFQHLSDLVAQLNVDRPHQVVSCESDAGAGSEPVPCSP